jgi:hypothetical protein
MALKPSMSGGYMKRLILLASAFVLAIPAPFVAAPAAAEGRTGVVEFCKVDVPQNPPAVLGNCVGFINTLTNESPGLVPILCDYFEMFFPDVFYGAYDDHGQCVVDRAQQLPF